MTVKPKPSKLQGSTAKKRVPASRASKKAFHKPKPRESFVFTKAPLMSPLTLQELPCMQAAGSLDLSSEATPPSPIKGGDCPSSIDSLIFKKSKPSGDNQSVNRSP